MDRATDAILFEDTLLQLLHSEQLKSRLLFIHTLIQLSTIVHNKLLYAPFISIVIVRYPEGVWTHEGQRKNATITVSEYIDVLIPIRSLSLDHLLLYCGRYEGILAKIQRLLLIPQSCKQYDSGPTMHLHGFPRTSWNDHDLVLTFFFPVYFIVIWSCSSMKWRIPMMRRNRGSFFLYIYALSTSS